ncbi:MAG: hypothetical protein NTV80_05655 [Verrucomicrobia bacterium]|nr:hypothetical protein [Verrucomicrobiota bacterium]
MTSTILDRVEVMNMLQAKARTPGHLAAISISFAGFCGAKLPIWRVLFLSGALPVVESRLDTCGFDL